MRVRARHVSARANAAAHVTQTVPMQKGPLPGVRERAFTVGKALPNDMSFGAALTYTCARYGKAALRCLLRGRHWRNRYAGCDQSRTGGTRTALTISGPLACCQVNRILLVRPNARWPSADHTIMPGASGGYMQYNLRVIFEKCPGQGALSGRALSTGIGHAHFMPNIFSLRSR